MDNFFAPARQSETSAIAKVDPAAMAAAEAAKAQIQAAYIMAFQKPRREMDARDRILTACKRTEFAEKAEYSKPVGDKKIKGPSIRFAELALREWGNIRTESTVMYEDDDIRRIRVSCLDLETNAQFLKDIQIKKTIERKSKKGRDHDVIADRKNSFGDTVYILRATDEEMMTKESAWVSKIIRNEGLRLIPSDIIEEGMSLCRLTLTEKAKKDPAGEKKKILDSFSGIGVKPSELEKYLKHSMDTISPAELNELRTVFSAIREGEATWNDYVNPPEGKEESAAPNVAAFDAWLSEKKLANNELELMLEYIKINAATRREDVNQFKSVVSTSENGFDDFWLSFLKWCEKKTTGKNSATDEKPIDTHVQEPNAAKSPTIDDIPPDNATVLPENKADVPPDRTHAQTKKIYALGKESGLDSDSVISFLNVLKEKKPDLFFEYQPGKLSLTKKGATELIDNFVTYYDEITKVKNQPPDLTAGEFNRSE